MNKRARFAAPTSAVAGASEALMPTTNISISTEDLPLTRISLDPENPKSLGIAPDDLMGEEPPHYDDSGKQDRLEELLLFAETIKKRGLINPISVYRHGNDFRIISGERRYLAHVWLKYETIASRIHQRKPKQLRTSQYDENAKRTRLTLIEEIRNVQAIILEHKQAGIAVDNFDELCRVLDCKRHHGYRMWAVLHAPIDVHDAINAGLITSVSNAAEIAVLESEEARAAAISGQGSPKKAKNIPAVVRSRGRPPANVVAVGRVNSSQLKNLMCAIDKSLGDEIDWNNPRQVKAGFLKLLKKLEANG